MTDHLDPHEVLEGYRKGIFPMGYMDAPVYSWHLPEQRGVLPLEQFHISRSLALTLRQKRFTVTFDTAFEEVMRACASRGGEDPEETWITERIVAVYSQLQKEGCAHSVEVWVDGELAGDLESLCMCNVISLRHALIKWYIGERNMNKRPRNESLKVLG